MTFLLDVNVLIALLDHQHIAHDLAHRWYRREGRVSWATCPITQNGAVRIMGHPRYPAGFGSCVVASHIVGEFCRAEAHQFWADSISLLDADSVDPARLPTSGHLTDTYLLALAVHHKGKLATLDRRLSSSAVQGGRNALEIIA